MRLCLSALPDLQMSAERQSPEGCEALHHAGRHNAASHVHVLAAAGVAYLLTCHCAVQLSQNCRSLLDAIFQKDVKQRITVEGIMQHPWYREPLPSQFQSQWDQLMRIQSQKEADQQSRQIDPVRLYVSLLPLLFMSVMPLLLVPVNSSGHCTCHPEELA